VLDRVEVEDDEVPPVDAEAREAVGGVLGVEDVLKHDEGRSFRGLGVPETDLAHGAVLAKEVVELLRGDGEGEVADEEDPVFL